MIKQILAHDNNLIVYRKELNAITGSVTATILLQQIIYWDSISNGDEFYKFIEPCSHEKYNDGDSWSEELGFTKREFQTAYKKLEEAGIVSKRVTRDRVTYYKLDGDILEKLLIDLYIGNNEKEDENSCVPSKSTNPHLAKVTFVPSKSTNPHLVYSKNKSRDYTETTHKKNIIKKFSFSLPKSLQYEHTSEEYKEKLKAYAVSKDGGYNLQSFLDYHLAKGSKFKDWSRAYNTWVSNSQKFDKINPNDYKKTIEHEEFGELAIEYGTNNLYDTKELKFVGRIKERIERKVSNDTQAQHQSSNKGVMDAMSKLASMKRTRVTASEDE